MPQKAKTAKQVTTKPMITKEMTISEVVTKWPKTADIFMERGLFCFGCGVARFETIEQGAMAHGIPIDELITALNETAAKA